MEHCSEGYSRTAAFLSSETNFSLYRGFGYLFSRVLLNLQDEIAALERELQDLDRMQGNNGERERLGSRSQDIAMAREEKKQRQQQSEEGGIRVKTNQRDRQTILADIQSKLQVYGQTLQQARDIGSFQKPSDRDYHSVRTWFWNNSALVENEAKFIRHREDIISLHHGREWSTFDAIVEKLLMSLTNTLKLKILRVSCTTSSVESNADHRHRGSSPRPTF